MTDGGGRKKQNKEKRNEDGEEKRDLWEGRRIGNEEGRNGTTKRRVDMAREISLVREFL